MKPSQKMILLALLPLAMLCSSCATPTQTFYNDSDQLMAGNKGSGACPAVQYDWVVMSKGKFRDVTSLNPDPDKCFKLEYVPCQ